MNSSNCIRARQDAGGRPHGGASRSTCPLQLGLAFTFGFFGACAVRHHSGISSTIWTHPSELHACNDDGGGGRGVSVALPPAMCNVRFRLWATKCRRTDLSRESPPTLVRPSVNPRETAAAVSLLVQFNFLSAIAAFTTPSIRLYERPVAPPRDTVVPNSSSSVTTKTERSSSRASHTNLRHVLFKRRV
jgi:hypothetical protein